MSGDAWRYSHLVAKVSAIDNPESRFLETQNRSFPTPHPGNSSQPRWTESDRAIISRKPLQKCTSKPLSDRSQWQNRTRNREKNTTDFPSAPDRTARQKTSTWVRKLSIGSAVHGLRIDRGKVIPTSPSLPGKVTGCCQSSLGVTAAGISPLRDRSRTPRGAPGTGRGEIDHARAAALRSWPDRHFHCARRDVLCALAGSGCGRHGGRRDPPRQRRMDETDAGIAPVVRKGSVHQATTANSSSSGNHMRLSCRMPSRRKHPDGSSGTT